jgi:TPR repeat protein
VCSALLVGVVAASDLAGASSADWWNAYQRGDYAEALPAIRANAEGGDMDAQFALAQIYDAGAGVEQDKSRAAELYRKAAIQGHLDAQHRIGLAELYGWGIDRSAASGAHWIHRAAERGHGGAQWTLGRLFAHGGVMYGLSDADYPQDGQRALQWFRRAAEQGDAFIQAKLAFMLVLGDRVPEDDAEGARWYERSARAGYVGSQLQMGMLYSRGEGVEQDPVRAYAWYQVAIKKGTWAKESELSPLQERMTKDQLYELGAAQGYRIALELRNELADALTPDQRARADGIAAALLSSMAARQ